MSFNVAFCINRIRLEFKVFYQKRYFETLNVLIESDWNLKILAFAFNVPAASVLIESDWNLKERESKRFQRRAEVLIESDWNLKRITTPFRVGLFLY